MQSKMANFDHLTIGILKFWPWSWSKIVDHLTMTPGRRPNGQKSWSSYPLIELPALCQVTDIDIFACLSASNCVIISYPLISAHSIIICAIDGILT